MRCQDQNLLFLSHAALHPGSALITLVHMAGCPGCRERYDQLNLASRGLERLSHTRFGARRMILTSGQLFAAAILAAAIIAGPIVISLMNLSLHHCPMNGHQDSVRYCSPGLPNDLCR